MPLNVWRPKTFEGLELSAYEGHNRTFLPSLLSGYNFGVRLAGIRETTYGGRRFRSGPGSFLAYTPGIGLAAKPVAGDAWRHQDMSISVESLQELLGPGAPNIDTLNLTGKVDRRLNDALFKHFRASHASLRQNAPRLEAETKLLAWLTPLLSAALKKPLGEDVGREHRAVALTKDYLHAHLELNVGLSELSDLAGLSRDYLMRVFQRETGLTPYQYQAGLRLAQAKRLLATGFTSAQVATEVGLYDQSALNRLFKRHVFLTPGQYQKLVADS